MLPTYLLQPKLNIKMSITKSKHTVHELHYHLVWCTKYRRPVIKETLEHDLRHVIHQCAKSRNWRVLEYESMPDHVHILVSCSPEYSPREIAQTLKSVSAVTMFTKHPTLKK